MGTRDGGRPLPARLSSGPEQLLIQHLSIPAEELWQLLTDVFIPDETARHSHTTSTTSTTSISSAVVQLSTSCFLLLDVSPPSDPRSCPSHPSHQSLSLSLCHFIPSSLIIFLFLALASPISIPGL